MTGLKLNAENLKNIGALKNTAFEYPSEFKEKFHESIDEEIGNASKSMHSLAVYYVAMEGFAKKYHADLQDVSSANFTQAQSDEIGKFVELEQNYFKSLGDDKGWGVSDLESIKSLLGVEKDVCTKMLTYCRDILADKLGVFPDVLATNPPGYNASLSKAIDEVSSNITSTITLAQKYVDTALVDCDKLIDMDKGMHDKLFDHVSNTVNKSVYDCVHDLSAASSGLKTDAKDAVKDWINLIDTDALSYEFDISNMATAAHHIEFGFDFFAQISYNFIDYLG